MSSGYFPSELTIGERLWLTRRRSGHTLQDQAAYYGVSHWRYTEWEHDRPTAEAAPWVPVDSLNAGEQCALARRRSGWPLRRVAREARISHVTVLKWERSLETVGNPLWEWWDLYKGWPRRVGVAA